jgi:choline dehydrogenase-like flavoprotein
MRIDLTGQVEAFASPVNEIRLAAGKTRFGMPRTEFVFQPSSTDASARERHLLHLEAIFKAMGADRIELIHDAPSAGTHMGSSCRMARDEKEGVTTPDLGVHGIDNLYLCSNAVFPNIGAVNPTLTLAALALRLADHLSG